MTSATLSDVFFSLKGTLTRRDWGLAMIAAASLFFSGASFIVGAGAEVDAFDTRTVAIAPLQLLLIFFVCVAALLCAKRLLHCERPAWLALTIPPPAILLAFAYEAHIDAWNPALLALAFYFAVVSLPAVLGCTLPDDHE